MKLRNRVLAIVQRVFGAALLFFGLNKIFSLVPLPEKQGFAQLFIETITGAGYIMPIIMVVQIAVGLALLFNRYVALALIIMFPISLNIFFFHLFQDLGAIAPATMFIAWNSVLMIANLPKYRPILAAH